jgi:small subunit ribosomal protein S21
MAEVRLQERESLENALRRFKRKVMTEDIIKGCEAPLLLSKARRKTPGETSFGTKTCPKKIRKDSDQVAPRRGAAAK